MRILSPSTQFLPITETHTDKHIYIYATTYKETYTAYTITSTYRKIRKHSYSVEIYRY